MFISTLSIQNFENSYDNTPTDKLMFVFQKIFHYCFLFILLFSFFFFFFFVTPFFLFHLTSWVRGNNGSTAWNRHLKIVSLINLIANSKTTSWTLLVPISTPITKQDSIFYCFSNSCFIICLKLSLKITFMSIHYVL